jgi:hypothetical protein
LQFAVGVADEIEEEVEGWVGVRGLHLRVGFEGSVGCRSWHISEGTILFRLGVRLR